MAGDFCATVASALIASVVMSCARGGAERREMTPARPQKPAQARTADDAWIEEALDHEGYCLPEEAEICGCPGGVSGARRCNAAGTAFGPCDACASLAICGSARCEVVRVDALALSVAPCCPEGRLNRCGVDVSHFMNLHGYTTACLELDAPGTHDATCPSTSVPLPGKGEVTLHGCRTPSGVCGYDVDVPGVIDLGCTVKPERGGS